jgi:undecaprenyl-diphosphatase
MGISEIIILGLVQGLTEFLPVSSSGHLVAVRLLFGVSDMEGSAFDAFLHLGTLLAVLVYYWRVWWGITRSIFKNDVEGADKRQLAVKLALATVPAAIAGYFLQDYIANVFRSNTSVAFGLGITAVILAFVDLLAKKPKVTKRASFSDAIFIGLAQVLALVPGVSRSGTTIAAGRSRGLSRKQAVAFSFLLSAPIIAGAGLMSVGSIVSGGAFSVGQLTLGLAVSFLGGLTAIHFLLKFIERISFLPFTFYLLGLAGVLIYFG